MNLIEKATILHFHRHRIAEFQSGTIGALGWRGPESQLRRFEVLAGVGDFTGASVLDAGCGHGDLKAYLDERFSGFTYIGIDQMPEFIAMARSKFEGRPGTYFYQSDFTTAELPKVDYVIASGALAYRCQDPNFHFDMIARLYRSARRALAFNMLDAARFPPHDLLTGHDPETVMAFCRGLCPNSRLVRGYLEDDFTVMMYP